MTSLPPDPRLTFVMRIRIVIAEPVELGESLGFFRRIVPITGGDFDGPEISGMVLTGGADWQMTRPDRVAVLDARYTLRTQAGELIGVENRGFRHGRPDLAARIAAGERVPRSEYYFMTAPLFETSAEPLQWMTRTVFVADGERTRDEVLLNVWRVGDSPLSRREGHCLAG